MRPVRAARIMARESWEIWACLSFRHHGSGRTEVVRCQVKTADFVTLGHEVGGALLCVAGDQGVDPPRERDWVSDRRAFGDHGLLVEQSGVTLEPRVGRILDVQLS